MPKLIPVPRKGESMKDYRKRLVERHNSSSIVRLRLKRKIN